MAVFVTGAAGFIGYHASYELLKSGETVHGVDNLNAYYDPNLKQARLERLKQFSNFHFTQLDISDVDTLKTALHTAKPERILHLAAQAGVRYSLKNPMAYIQSNLVGHLSILEACRSLDENKPGFIKHIVYASSSSVYGECQTAPFKESFQVDRPVSLYAATKKSDELISHSYSHLYGLAQTGLRFFTVYGSWGRPDMAYWLFCEALLKERPIRLFNHGNMERDFTYIGDLLPCLMKCLYDTPPPHSHNIYNIGGAHPVPLMEMVETLEKLTGKKAQKKFIGMQAGDVTKTSADVSKISQLYGYQAHTPLKEGLREFVNWYQNWHNSEI